MKKIQYFYLEDCPYCRQASRWLDELLSERTEYGAIEIERIEESRQRKLADSFDYYYVPTFFVDGRKLHEGAATKDAVRRVLDAALA